MKQTRLTDTITYVEPTDIHSNMSSAALVVSSTPAVVIDLNLSENDTIGILQEVKPARAYTTHFHYDHSQFWKRVAQYSSASFHLPTGEAKMLTDPDEFVARTFGHHANADIRKTFLALAGYERIDNFETYDGNHRFRSGSTMIESILTPGHSPAHMSFYLPEECVMFAGDLGLGRFGPWYGWVSCDIEAYIESLLRLKGYNTRTLLTSHDGIIKSDIDGAWDTCLKQFFSREADIRRKLDAGRNEDQIAAEGIYFTNKDQVQEPMKTVITIWDRIMLEHHLKILEKGSLEKLFA